MANAAVSRRSFRQRNNAVTSALGEAKPMGEFLAGVKALTPCQRATIVQQALVCLENLYVNLPLKCAMYAVDPLQRLRLLRQRLSSVFNTDSLFHREMTEIFNSLNDLHCNYLLPEPYASHTAWLPFAIEAFYRSNSDKRVRYLATKVAREFIPHRDRDFCEGVEILAWNGVPIGRAVELFGEQSPVGAGNIAARHAVALYFLTQRPLQYLLPPDEEWVILGYRPLNSSTGLREIRLTWRCLDNARAGMMRTSNLPAGVVQSLRRLLFTLKATEEPVEARTVKTAYGRFGYLRIRSFDVDFNAVDQFVADVVAKVKGLPAKGLIVDVRDNSGGRTAAAERIVQLFAPDHPPARVEPTRLYLINTPLMLQFCRLQADNPRLSFRGLKPWIESMARAMETGTPYSAAFPITDPELCNNERWRYPGPVIVITNGLSLSSAEVFSAGFQDHGGRVLGVDPSTGGAGASVRKQSQFTELFANAADSPFEELPRKVDFSVTFRRFQRVGRNAGTEIEDFGVIRDYPHRMTRNDVLKGNVDLINEAARLLVSKDFRAHVSVG